MALSIHPDRARQVGLALLDALHGVGILGRVSMPEHLLPPDVERGSREHLHFVTLTVAIDYMRNADELWRAARETYIDPHTRYLYTPQAVARTEPARLIADMQRHKLSRKPVKDADFWRRICTTLDRHFGGDVWNLLDQARFNAPLVLATIRNTRYDFPYLRGEKIGPLWVRMLEDSWQGHHLEDLQQVQIPVDVHIAAASVMTGCVQGPYRGPFDHLRDAVREAWAEACATSEHFPLQFDEPLWRLSRRGCRKTQRFPCQHRSRCPVASFCTSTPLLKDGNQYVIE